MHVSPDGASGSATHCSLTFIPDDSCTIRTASARPIRRQVMTRHTGSLAFTGILLLAFARKPVAQTPEIPKAPRGFDVRRANIERGAVETVDYESKTVGDKRKLVVYLPPGHVKETKYPVFYLLHGKGGNETHWVRAGAAATILDNL